jgi:hypothetical protein
MKAAVGLVRCADSKSGVRNFGADLSTVKDYFRTLLSMYHA